ncbi:hypothetical protein L4C34_19385 [Vibrio profundum]|uniref:hypothetical protein n=1 Tax=Vibrio profundum TaxID=2910247 RepID=UPI003D0F7D6C
MRFENRMLLSEVRGSTNNEAAAKWLEDLKKHILSSLGGCELPWTVLIDGRDWELTSLDSKKGNDELITWSQEHRCALYAIVVSTKLQEFAAANEFNEESICFFATTMMKPTKPA